MPSLTLTEMLDHLVARENAATYDSLLGRLEADLHEWSPEDVSRLIVAADAGSRAQSDSIEAYVIALLCIGVEIGRELERRI